MPTDEIKNLVEKNLEKHKGPFGIGAFIISLSIIVLKLPPDYLDRLKENMFVIAVPSFIVLLGAIGQAYLVEQRNRTKVEIEFSTDIRELVNSLKGVTDRLEKIFSELNTRLDRIDDKIAKVYLSLEKRHELIHTGDTEKWVNANTPSS